MIALFLLARGARNTIPMHFVCFASLLTATHMEWRLYLPTCTHTMLCCREALEKVTLLHRAGFSLIWSAVL